jgi:hypothetical protein
VPDTTAPQIPPLSVYTTLVLGDDASFTPDVYGEIGVLTFNGGAGLVGVSTTSVEVLLALADAAQATAAKLRVAQLRGEARRAVA